jgi:hypothetical protein
MRQDFFGHDQVTDIGPAEVATCITSTVCHKWITILLKLGITQVDTAAGDES